jgi:hypothetical protein
VARSIRTSRVGSLHTSGFSPIQAHKPAGEIGEILQDVVEGLRGGTVDLGVDRGRPSALLQPRRRFAFGVGEDAGRCRVRAGQGRPR